MKKLFSGFYPPTPDEYQRLWKEGTVVLDTNVLLNLYRLPASARDEFLATLELLKDRLWIPYQVALEFQKRRLTVIASERKSIDDVLASAQGVVQDLCRKVEALQIEKRGIGIDPKPILSNLQQANERLIQAVQAAHESQHEIASTDSIRDRLDELLGNNVGGGPKTQDDLDELEKGGEERYKEKIPPGFADLEKSKNPNESVIVNNHLKYQRKYGDLVLWRQLLRHAKDESLKCVLFVTADGKDDWWWREQGKTLGAHPELVAEIQRASGVESFWMYSPVQFIEHANKYVAARVSTQSVQELQDVVMPFAKSDAWNYIIESLPQNDIYSWFYEQDDFINLKTKISETEKLVADWIRNTTTEIITSASFPEIITYDGIDHHGYELIITKNIWRTLSNSITINGISHKAITQILDEKIGTFSIILITREDDYSRAIENDEMKKIEKQMLKILQNHHINNIITGAIINKSFRVISWLNRKDCSNQTP